ncbi:DUF1771 domain-containing protein [Candidatus Saccharibacteria bacterium]|nr:DUF1771 domain-containing protein [Candidatus Saccharibacteria bacterium]
MLRNSELDRLKEEQQSLFEQKQVAFQKFKDLQEQTNTAHDAMQSAWDERVSTRERMNAEFEARQSAYSHRNLVWDEYGRIRDYNNSRIESLKYEADAEHRAMQDCFERASDAYQYGDKSEAPYYSQEGHAHKDRRDELNAEISELAREVKQAKAHAEALAPRIDSSAFNCAKSAFESAKARHESAQAEFKRLKGRRDSAKSEFDQLQARFKQAQDAFNRKLEEVKANRQRERDEVLDKAGVRYSERKDAKIVKKSDGTTQVYHGGIGSGDGYGHGHTALDQFGRKTYERGAFEEHGKQNFTDDPALTSYSGKGQWSEIRHGWLGNHKVTWSEGIGVNAGQTLIRDDWVDKDEFDKHHDHYGPDSKYKSGKRIEDITDSLGREKYYSGPSK